MSDSKKKPVVSKKLVIFSIIFLSICGIVLFFISDNPSATNSINKNPNHVNYHKQIKPAPKSVDVPHLTVNTAGNENTKLLEFKKYLQDKITNDTKLTKQDKALYENYIIKLDQLITQANHETDSIKELRQLSEAYRIRTLQSQIIDQERKISDAKLAIQKDQEKSLQLIGVDQSKLHSEVNGSKNVQDVNNSFKISMIYSSNGKLAAILDIDGEKFGPLNIGDNFDNDAYQVLAIQPDEVSVLSNKDKIKHNIRMNMFGED